MTPHQMLQARKAANTHRESRQIAAAVSRAVAKATVSLTEEVQSLRTENAALAKRLDDRKPG